MAISIYVGKDNLPKDKEFIFDAESYFVLNRMIDCEFTREVLRKIEKGEFVDNETFKDRLGRGLFLECLSTSSKILILLNQNPDLVINCCELGLNAVDMIMQIKDCNVYFENDRIDFQSEKLYDVFVNGYRCEDIDEVNNRIHGEE